MDQKDQWVDLVVDEILSQLCAFTLLKGDHRNLPLDVHFLNNSFL